jgi:hypothetical protein
MRANGDAHTGVPVLRMPNIQDGRIDLSSLKHVKPDTEGLDAFRLRKGDVLFNRTNSPGLVGKAAVFDLDKDAVFASYLVRLTCDESRISSRFLCAWINSPWGRKWAWTVRTDCVSQSNINSSKLRRMPVPTPPLSEQQEVVERIEALFQFADDVEAQVGKATAEAETLAQAVRDKALRGELVPTVAELARQEGRSFEPGWVLLGRVKPEPARKLRSGRSGLRVAERPTPRKAAPRSRPASMPRPEEVPIAFRQACWGGGAVSEDELIRKVARRLGIGRLGKKQRRHLREHLEVAIDRRIVVRRGDLLEGATPTFARYDDEFLFKVLRSVLRRATECEVDDAVRMVASHLGFGQVTAAVRSRMHGLFRTGVRSGLLGMNGDKIWRRGS